MALPWKDRISRKNQRDLWTAIGVVLVTAAVLFSLPEVDADLPRELILGLVAVGAIVFVIARRFGAWKSKHRRHRGHRHHRT